MSWSKALRRYISLPIASDQLAQLVPGLGGDTFRVYRFLAGNEDAGFRDIMVSDGEDGVIAL